MFEKVELEQLVSFVSLESEDWVEIDFSRAGAEERPSESRVLISVFFFN